MTLTASARARQPLERYDRASTSILREVLAELPAADRSAPACAMPAPARLLAALDR